MSARQRRWQRRYLSASRSQLEPGVVNVDLGPGPFDYLVKGDANVPSVHHDRSAGGSQRDLGSRVDRTLRETFRTSVATKHSHPR